MSDFLDSTPVRCWALQWRQALSESKYTHVVVLVACMQPRNFCCFHCCVRVLIDGTANAL